MNIALTIKITRILRGQQQRDLARLLDCSANYISLIETNKREPSLTFLRKLAGIWGISLSSLVDAAEKQPDPQELTIREHQTRKP